MFQVNFKDLDEICILFHVTDFILWAAFRNFKPHVMNRYWPISPPPLYTRRVILVTRINGLDDRGSIPDRGRIFFPFATASRPTVGPTQPPIQWVPGLKRPGREAYHYPLSKVKMRGVIPPLPHTSSWTTLPLLHLLRGLKEVGRWQVVPVLN
jgi:hypothetical protein